MSGVSLYLIEILHQTTTVDLKPHHKKPLYLIEILHQTTTAQLGQGSSRCCILSKFYIKPQHAICWLDPCCVVSYRNSTSNHNSKNKWSFNKSVVSYRNSTSNHNSECAIRSATPVVSYRNSTSNHNSESAIRSATPVVSYRNSTSNHNRNSKRVAANVLYLIEILHQTTTSPRARTRSL